MRVGPKHRRMYLRLGGYVILSKMFPLFTKGSILNMLLISDESFDLIFFRKSAKEFLYVLSRNMKTKR